MPRAHRPDILSGYTGRLIPCKLWFAEPTTHILARLARPAEPVPSLTVHRVGARQQLLALRPRVVNARQSVVVQANLFARIGRIFKSYANSIGAPLPFFFGLASGYRDALHVDFVFPGSTRHARSHTSCTPGQGTVVCSVMRDVMQEWSSTSDRVIPVSSVSSGEDPERILDQAVEDMNADLIKLRQATAKVHCSSCSPFSFATPC
jgi:hypothetical protein